MYFFVLGRQSLTDDVIRQMDREKQLQTKYGLLEAELFELKRNREAHRQQQQYEKELSNHVEENGDVEME